MSVLAYLFVMAITKKELAQIVLYSKKNLLEGVSYRTQRIGKISQRKDGYMLEGLGWTKKFTEKMLLADLSISEDSELISHEPNPKSKALLRR